MHDDELVASLQNTAYTTGAGVNCYFQAFIHTLCAQPTDVIAKMDALPATRSMIDVFNKSVPNVHVNNMTELITIAKAMHPLERELIFGTLMRTTFNELGFEAANGDKIYLPEGALVNPQHSIPFAHAFGFSLDVYTHSSDAKGMPEELKNDPLMFGNVTFYREHCPLANNIGELILRVKSRHFEIGGWSNEDVLEHQNKIIPLAMDGKNKDRTEAPGARYYEEPSIPEECAVMNAGVSFNIAVSNTVEALMRREGNHQKLMTIPHNELKSESAQQEINADIEQIKTVLIKAELLSRNDLSKIDVKRESNGNFSIASTPKLAEKIIASLKNKDLNYQQSESKIIITDFEKIMKITTGVRPLSIDGAEEHSNHASPRLSPR